jgi:two-component system OmpR family sensor kinase/two-component system sensor histidine kinase BaeS
MKSSVNDIRFRLFSLLLRAFIIVLIVAFLIFQGIIGYVLSAQPNLIRAQFPFISILEGYYIGRGSWEGVDAALQVVTDSLPLDQILLLDEKNRIILDLRTGAATMEGTPFEILPGHMVIPLRAGEDDIAKLVLLNLTFEQRFRFAIGILTPVAITSLILASFMAIIASLLMRRFVNPLADVIFAAHSVANGRLDTRIPMQGPQDLRSLSESFNEMASSLERNDRERRDLLADIAHELRTPLSVIRGRLEGVVDGIYKTDDGQVVSLALEQTYLLERLVDDLRLLTLAETRQLRFEKKSVDLAQLSQHIINMEQVIGNLIGNSLRYIPTGSKIWLALEKTSDEVKLFVNDNGPGVAEDELPYLFDRFWRKEKSRTRSAGGTGLGLTIAKQLVEAQGGKISAMNLPEGGLQVVIIFAAL